MNKIFWLGFWQGYTKTYWFVAVPFIMSMVATDWRDDLNNSLIQIGLILTIIALEVYGEHRKHNA